MLLRKYQQGVTDFGSGLRSSTNFASTTGSDFSVTGNEELSCPQGYVYDRVKKICVSISQSANFSDRKGRVDEIWKDVPDFEIKELKNLKYLDMLPGVRVNVVQTDYVETPESDRSQDFDHIIIHPKPNYKLIIDKTKPEGYFDKVNNILYTQTADSPHSKKFNEWNKLIELEEENLNKIGKYKNIKLSDPIDKIYGWANENLLESYYKDPIYYNKDKITTNQEYVNKICPQCATSHGSSYTTDNDYLIENRNRKNARLTDETTPFVLTSTTTTPTKAAYRKENYITYTPIEGTDYLLMKQDYRKGKEPYQTWGDKGWVDNPKSKLIYHLDASGNEIASPKNALSETQYKEYLKAGLIKPTKNLSVTNQRKGGILLIKYI